MLWHCIQTATIAQKALLHINPGWFSLYCSEEECADYLGLFWLFEIFGSTILSSSNSNFQ